MKQLAIIIFCFFMLSSCIRVQIPVETQQRLARLEVKVDSNTVNIKKNYQSFLKILQNATNPNGTYVPLSDDDLLKIINGTTDGKRNKN